MLLCCNSTRALIAGGYTPTYMDRIEYITIATLGDAVDFGNLTANGTATDKAGLSQLEHYLLEKVLHMYLK